MPALGPCSLLGIPTRNGANKVLRLASQLWDQILYQDFRPRNGVNKVLCLVCQFWTQMPCQDFQPKTVLTKGCVLPVNSGPRLFCQELQPKTAFTKCWVLPADSGLRLVVGATQCTATFQYTANASTQLYILLSRWHYSHEPAACYLVLGWVYRCLLQLALNSK